MSFIYAEDVEGFLVPRPFERRLKVIMAPEKDTDVESFTLIYSTLAPRGGCTEMHVHEGSGELMVFTSGEGRAWLAGEEHRIKPGAAMFAPPGVEHRTLNTGDVPLEIVCVFTPPVPGEYVNEMLEIAAGAEAESGGGDGGKGS